MEFQVPQFIETKPKIIGPLDLSQFLYLGGAAAISIFSFMLFNFFVWFLITLIVGLLAFALAFLKINGQPFPVILMAMVKYIWQPKIYFWKREISQTTLEIPEEVLQKTREKMSIQEKLKAAAQRVMTSSKTKIASTGRPSFKKGEFAIIEEQTGERKVVKRVNY